MKNETVCGPPHQHATAKYNNNSTCARTHAQTHIHISVSVLAVCARGNSRCRAWLPCVHFSSALRPRQRSRLPTVNFSRWALLAVVPVAPRQQFTPLHTHAPGSTIPAHNTIIARSVTQPGVQPPILSECTQQRRRGRLAAEQRAELRPEAAGYPARLGGRRPASVLPPGVGPG